MSGTDKKRDQEKGDEILKRMLKTRPKPSQKPKCEEGSSKKVDNEE
jgi:hypothetical protein